MNTQVLSKLDLAFENYNYSNATLSKEQAINQAKAAIQESFIEKGYDLDMVANNGKDEITIVDKDGIAIYIDHSRIDVKKFIEGELFQKRIIKSEGKTVESIQNDLSDLKEQLLRQDPNYARKQKALKDYDQQIEEAYKRSGIKDRESYNQEVKEYMKSVMEAEQENERLRDEEKKMLLDQRASWYKVDENNK